MGVLDADGDGIAVAAFAAVSVIAVAALIAVAVFARRRARLPRRRPSVPLPVLARLDNVEATLRQGLPLRRQILVNSEELERLATEHDQLLAVLVDSFGKAGVATGGLPRPRGQRLRCVKDA